MRVYLVINERPYYDPDGGRTPDIDTVVAVFACPELAQAHADQLDARAKGNIYAGSHRVDDHVVEESLPVTP